MARNVAIVVAIIGIIVLLGGCAAIKDATGPGPSSLQAATPASAGGAGEHQSAISHISGRIVDSSGSDIPGATVQLLKDGTPVQVSDNPQATDTGTYDFKISPGSLAPGKYTVRADKSDGFGTSSYSSFTFYYDGHSDAIRDIRLLGFGS